MQFKTAISLSFAAAAFAAAPAALAQHAGDVGINIIDNRIVTGSYELGVFTPGQRPPARTSVGVSALPLGAGVEIAFAFYRG